MTKLTSTLFALSALLASGAFAQQDVPGEARALASPPATKAERQAARQQRLATSKELVNKDKGRLDDVPASAGTARRATSEERLAARAKRRATGAEAARADTGRVPESETTR